MHDHTESQNLIQATIQRCPHDGENPYAMINLHLIRDESISPECRWMLIYLLSNKEGWKIRIAEVANHVKNHISKKRVYALFREAIEAGYIKREFHTSGNIRQAVIYYLSETPKFKKCFRHSHFGDVDARDVENGHHKKEYSKSIGDNSCIDKKKQDKQPIPAAPSLFSRKKIKEEKKETAPRVFVSDFQEKSLLKKLNEDNVLLAKCYEKLSDWKIGKGITGGANDYATIIKWVIAAVKDEAISSTKKSNYPIENRILAEKVWQKCKGRTDIHLGNAYIEFSNGVNAEPSVLKFDSKDFKNLVLEQLKRRKIIIENL